MIRTVSTLLIFALALSAPNPAQTSADKSDMVATGGASSQSTAYGKDLGFWITLKNQTHENISNVRLIRTPDAYELKQICTFESSQGSHCRDRQTFQKEQEVVIANLSPGQTLAISGTLNTLTPHEEEALSAVLAWNGPPNATESSTVVSLGNNLVQDGWQRTWAFLAELAKSLAIPAGLAVLGFFLNNLAKTREEVRAATERILSLRAETWKQMLPISHNYAAKYYLPVSTAAENAVQEFQGTNYRLAFFYFLMVLRRMSATTDEIGGFYFKDLRGERLAAKCIKGFRQVFLGKETDPFSVAMKGSANLLKPTGTYEKFKEKFCNTQTADFTRPILQEAWMLFEQVRLEKARMEEAARYLSGLYTVLDYESNRPYQYWYDSSPQVVVAPDTQQLLSKLGGDLQFTETEINDYITAMKMKK